MSTQDNLMAAFAGESQANRKYLAFAQKAEQEGYPNVARVYRAIAEAETVHALKHLEVAGKVGATLENLDASVQGEHYEFTVMYPQFIEVAKAEGHGRARHTFEFANEAEKVHGRIFAGMREAVAGGKDHAGGRSCSARSAAG
jgi:rubrerythrin